MPTKDGLYSGIDNRDLRLINVSPWEIPRPLRNEKVRVILAKINIMEPGEIIKAEMPAKEVWLIRSAVWRLVKKHGLGVVVTVRQGQLYIRKPE